jgi:tight adherence protein B
MRRVPVALAGIALGLSVVTGTTPAWAATDLVLSDVVVDAAVRTVDLRVSAEDLPPGAGIDPASVRASVAGRSLPVASVAAARTTLALPPKVLVVVDTSGSMAGQPMVDAKQAVSAFVAQAPGDVQLGLLAFSTSPRLVVAPTTDRPVLLGAITGLEAQGETSLYDAVLAGVQAVGTSGDRRVVVLSDGGDTRSKATLDAALEATRASGVAVDAIGFNTDESVQTVLTQIAESGRGQVRSAASSAELAAALSASVREQATALDVKLLVPQDLRGPQDLSVQVTTQRGQLSEKSRVTLGATTVVPRDAGWWGTRDSLLVGLGAIAASLALTCLVLFGGTKNGKRGTQDILERYTTVSAQAPSPARTASPVARTALELAGRVVDKRNLAERSTMRLERAAVSWTPAEWLLLQFGASLGSALLLVLLGNNLLVALLVGSAAGVLLPRLYLSVRGGRRQKAFEEKLPDALQMTAGSLTAGYSLAQALDGLVREGSEPMATEIGRALAESRLGVPVEATLQGVADRMNSKDFGWVVMAIQVQREVGGNLGGVLTTVGATMRERQMLRRQVKGLSAEGRLSAYILLGLPLLLVAYMFLVRREYLEPLYTTVLGLGLIGVAVVLMSIGSFLMNRMVKVEV